jgi:hypothetical protein
MVHHPHVKEQLPTLWCNQRRHLKKGTFVRRLKYTLTFCIKASPCLPFSLFPSLQLITPFYKMTVIESNNRHSAINRKKLEQVKALTADLTGWEFSQEKDGVKLYSKSVEGSSIPLVRGDYLLKTTDYTAEQVAVVAALPGARAICKSPFPGSIKK